MARDIAYDFFVSYAGADNRTGWVDGFVAALVAEHARFTGGRTLTYFLDRNDIGDFAHWHAEIFGKGLARSRFFLAFLSPNYFASEICRREWKAWIDQEISLHILTEGSAPVYFVEVPGFLSKPMLPEHEVAAKVAELCGFPTSARFAADLSPVVKEARRRQVNDLVRPFRNLGAQAIREADLQAVLAKLAKRIAERAEEAKRADASANTVPPYNPKFTGRLDELIELRTMLTDNRAGVIAGIHGLGGIGKTELAYTFAHAYAGVYPGGRFEVRCEYQASLRDAINISLGDAAPFRPHISDEERKRPETHFAAVARCLKHRLDTLGPVLLLLDNVSEIRLLEPQETDRLTLLGPKLHLLATTRLAAGKAMKCLTLGEMKPEDALALLDKFRPIAGDADRAAAEAIVRLLGGFALAIELVAAKLAVTESATYAAVAEGLGLADLDTLAEESDVMLRRHNHEKRLPAVLGPTLDSLAAEERRAMEYAALLPPDRVPLPWLKPLVIGDFPELATPDKWGDPWLILVDRLVRLGLFTRVQEETTDKRQVRVHRLVQSAVLGGLAAEVREPSQKRIDDLVQARDAVLIETTQWVGAVWELEPLEDLAKLWDAREHPERSELLTRVASRLSVVAHYQNAESLFRRALAIEEARGGPDESEVGASFVRLADLLQVTSRLAEAEVMYRRALSILEAKYGPDHPEVATALNNFAQLLNDLDRVDEAEPLLRRALAIEEAHFGGNNPSTVSVLGNLAALYFERHRLAEAEPLFRRILTVYEAHHGPDHPNVATGLNNLAQVLDATDRRSDAESLYRRALAINEKSFGSHHPNVAKSLSSLATSLQTSKRYAEAEPLYRRALAIDETVFGPGHPNVAYSLSSLGLLLHRSNRQAEAEPLYRRALAIDVASYGPDHPNVAKTMSTFAGLLMQTRRPREAEPLLRKAIAIFTATGRDDVAHVKVLRTMYERHFGPWHAPGTGAGKASSRAKNRAEKLKKKRRKKR